MKKIFAFILGFGIIFALTYQVYAFSFSLGHFYATRYDTHSITEYNPSGAIVDVFTLSSLNEDQYLRGLAFGSDGLLYTTVGQTNNFRVFAINSLGNIQQTYMHTGSLRGNISYGKIDFDNNGHFYVSDVAGIVRFDIGSSYSGDRFSSITSPVFDIKVLPNNNMLVVTDSNLFELDSNGNLIRNISHPSVGFAYNRGVEYDPETNVIYVSMIGNPGFDFRILKLDGTTGQMLDNEYFVYADDLWFTDDERLIAASRTQSPGMFNKNLNYLGSFSGTEKIFVTQSPIPEPSSFFLFIAGLSVFLTFSKSNVTNSC